MNVDEGETEEVRSEPVQRTEREPNRNGPRPVSPRLLVAAQPNQQTEPRKQSRIPAGDDRGPRFIAPKSRVVNKRQRDVSECEHTDAGKRSHKEITRLSKTHGQSR